MDNQQQPVRDQGLISVASHVLDDSDIRSKIFFILLFKIGIEKEEILKGRQNCLIACSIHCKNVSGCKVWIFLYENFYE